MTDVATVVGPIVSGMEDSLATRGDKPVESIVTGKEPNTGNLANTHNDEAASPPQPS